MGVRFTFSRVLREINIVRVCEINMRFKEIKIYEILTELQRNCFYYNSHCVTSVVCEHYNKL